MSINLDASAKATYKDVEAQLGAKLDASVTGQGSVIEGKDGKIEVRAAAHLDAKGGVVAPEAFIEGMMDEIGYDPEDEENPITAKQIVDTIKDAEFTADCYTNGSYMYFNLDPRLIDLFQTFGAPFIDNHNKFYVYLGNSVNNLIVNYAADVKGGSTSTGDEIKEALQQYILQGVNYALQYNVSVAVSETDGWAIRLKADQSTLFAVLEDQELSEVSEAIQKIAKFNTLSLEIYLGFDEQDNVSQLSVNLDLDAKVNIEEGKFYDFPVGIDGTLKFGIGLDLVVSDKVVSVPDDLSSYESYCDATKTRHSMSYRAQFVDENSHQGPCGSCGDMMTEAHHFDYYWEGDNTHMCRCFLCDYEYVEEHKFDANGDCICGYHNWNKD